MPTACVCAQDRRIDRYGRAYIRVLYLQANEDEIERVAQQLRQSTKVLTRNLQVHFATSSIIPPRFWRRPFPVHPHLQPLSKSDLKHKSIKDLLSTWLKLLECVRMHITHVRRTIQIWKETCKKFKGSAVLWRHCWYGSKTLASTWNPARVTHTLGTLASIVSMWVELYNKTRIHGNQFLMCSNQLMQGTHMVHVARRHCKDKPHACDDSLSSSLYFIIYVASAFRR